MWSIGLLLVILGYAFVYVGTQNILTGGQGPNLFDALGIPVPDLVTGAGEMKGRRVPGSGPSAGKRVP